MVTQQDPGSSATSSKPDITASQLEWQETFYGSSRQERIAAAAYRRAEERDFAPGLELDDWLTAEREIDDAIAAKQLRSSTPSMG